MLALDVEIAPFHALCREAPELTWIADRRLGRVLRAPTFFEDALKTLLTTNCTWTQTIGMVGRLVETLGEVERVTGERAFPTPEAVRDAGIRVLVDDIRVGYRARGAIELAERAIAGELRDIDATETAVLRDAIRGWYGFGPYAVRSMLHVMAREADPVIDSWAIAQARTNRVPGRAATMKGLQRYYARWGRWRALVAWFDLNRPHYDEWPPWFTGP